MSEAPAQEPASLDVWDQYVCAMLPAVIARLETGDLQQWRDAPALIAGMADVMLRERRKREKPDAE